MAVGTSCWRLTLGESLVTLLGLGCPNPRMVPLLGLGLELRLGLGLVPFLGPNSYWDNAPVGIVPAQVGIVWLCPNFDQDSPSLSQLVLGLLESVSTHFRTAFGLGLFGCTTHDVY